MVFKSRSGRAIQLRTCFQWNELGHPDKEARRNLVNPTAVPLRSNLVSHSKTALKIMTRIGNRSVETNRALYSISSSQICLYERTVRYVPWGAGFSWRTV